MFRTAVLRSTAAALRTVAMRPIASNAARRLAIGAAAPRVSFAAPKIAAWQSVRCYSAAGSLERKDVYDRIKQLLAGFDKVRLPCYPRFSSRSVLRAPPVDGDTVLDSGVALQSHMHMFLGILGS